jgi:hypothetical protein
MKNNCCLTLFNVLGRCLGQGRARIWALLLMLAVLYGMPSQAATRIEAWISITNLPNANTNQLTWNASSNRVWTNLIFNAATHIQTTNNIQNSRTNLKVQLDTYKFRTWHVVQYGTNTNDVIVIAGTNEPISIAIAGLWASVRYVTNTVYISDFVLAPPNLMQSNNFLIWQWSSVATNLEKGTQAISYVGFPFTNFPHRLRTANPPMTNMSVYGGTNWPNDFLSTNGGSRNNWASNLLATNLTGYSQNLQNTNSTNYGGFQTNVSSIHSTNVAAGKLTASSGELDGVRITNAPSIHSLSNNFGHVVVRDGLLGTNIQPWGAQSGSISLVGDAASSLVNAVRAVGIGQSVSIDTNAENAVIIGYGNEFGGPSGGATNIVVVGKQNNNSALANNSIIVGFGNEIAHVNSGIWGNALISRAPNENMWGSSSQTNYYPGDVVIDGQLRADGTAKIANAVRYTQTGPWIFSIEGTYTSLNGGVNNVAQLSTNKWTRLSGNTSACNINSLRFGDGLPAHLREFGIINGSAHAQTLIDRLSDTLETQITNRLDLGGVSVTLQPGERAYFQHNATLGYTELIFPRTPTNLVIKSTGDFSGANTTNVVAFNAQQVQRMTNAMSTNTTFILSNILAGASVEIFLIGANGGVIASNYTFKLLTNSLPTASRITWQTNGVALTNGTYDYAVPSNSYAWLLLKAPFATNVTAEYKVGP